MIQRVTLVEKKGTFEEPDGEVLDVVNYNERQGLLVVLVADGQEREEGAGEEDEICGTKMTDGSICQRDPAECRWHS